MNFNFQKRICCLSIPPTQLDFNEKIQSRNQLEVFSVRRVTDDKQVADYYVMSGHYEVPRMPGYHEIKEQILECLTMPEHMARYDGVHLDEVIQHCKAAYQDVMVVLDTLEMEDFVYQPRNSYYQAC
ncbi:hypothetical protein MKW92_034244 [Papaver armeniacum]|nr:hypothetical protein MKW92_034244 [Papaver armeniacum]